MHREKSTNVAKKSRFLMETSRSVLICTCRPTDKQKVESLDSTTEFLMLNKCFSTFCRKISYDDEKLVLCNNVLGYFKPYA